MDRGYVLLVSLDPSATSIAITIATAMVERATASSIAVRVGVIIVELLEVLFLVRMVIIVPARASVITTVDRRVMRRRRVEGRNRRGAWVRCWSKRIVRDRIAVIDCCTTAPLLRCR